MSEESSQLSGGETFLPLEQDLHWTMSGVLQVKDCCVHGLVVNALVFHEVWRPARSFRTPWTQVSFLSGNDPAFLSVSEHVTIHSISHMEVLDSGHVCVDGRVLERYLSP